MIQLIILALAALLTSILSAIIGMGGGILLLAVMLSFLDHATTIPTHGAVQLVSNGTRIMAFLNHVDWRRIGQFALGAVPGSVLGGLLLVWLRGDRIETTEPYLKIAIGAYVLIMTFRPVRHRAGDPPATYAHLGRQFALFGLLAGTLGLTIGAIGPLIAPLFIHSGFLKQRLIATKAMCQACIHLLKVPIFLASGLVHYGELTRLIVIMSLMVIPGTLIGKRILGHVPEQTFITLYKLAMLAAGLKLLAYDGVYGLLS